MRHQGEPPGRTNAAPGHNQTHCAATQFRPPTFNCVAPPSNSQATSQRLQTTRRGTTARRVRTLSARRTKTVAAQGNSATKHEKRCGTTTLATGHQSAPRHHTTRPHENRWGTTQFTPPETKSVAPQQDSMTPLPIPTRHHQGTASITPPPPHRKALRRNTIRPPPIENHCGTTGFTTPEWAPAPHHQASDIRDTPNTLRHNTIRTPPNVIRCGTTGFASRHHDTSTPRSHHAVTCEP